MKQSYIKLIRVTLDKKSINMDEFTAIAVFINQIQSIEVYPGTTYSVIKMIEAEVIVKEPYNTILNMIAACLE